MWTDAVTKQRSAQLRYPSLAWTVLPVFVAAILLAPLIIAVPLSLLLAGLLAVLTVAAVYVHPPTAAYILLVVTPVTAGMERGLLVPLLRPHEAVAVMVAAGLVLRAVPRLAARHPILPRIPAVDVTILLMAFTSSVLPLLWMVARGVRPTIDDVLYAATLWKFYGVYLIVRASIRTDSQVRRCLWLSMGAAGVVAVIAVLQSLNLFGVPDLLTRFFVGDGQPEDFANGRGSSTLTSSIAVADVMTMNLVIALGYLLRIGRGRRILLAAMTIFTFGVLASGQFSGAIALLIGVVTVGLLTGRVRKVAVLVVPSLFGAALLLRPVIVERLGGFHSPRGLPQSWIVRLDNLQTFFWPKLFSGFNFVLGVRPEARILVNGDYVWIESGHTWLLWTGGIPFFVAFFVFLGVALSKTARIARARTDDIGIAAIASCTSLVMLGVLMTFDPHLTMRGTADLMFFLLALTATAGWEVPSPRGVWDGRSA
jgi:hypothetical protein